MCGIAGIWHLNESELTNDKLMRFTDSMIHRGPDGSGYHIFDNVALGFGHRRLSILDLSDSGKQPMNFADGRYWITYNGEVYNFIELKTELIGLGYKFITDTDTEVILAAYHCWGKKCMLKFNGMWAFAIYDTQEKVLFLARDRFGVKPLHYHFDRNKLFAFASETIAFKKLADFNRSINRTTLEHSINSFSSIEPWGYTIFNNIFQLLPGHYIELKQDSDLKQEKWWDTFDNLVSVPKTYEDQVETFRDLFTDACKIRMRSDVSIASALSGGVDSSAVYCMLHNLMNSSKKKHRIPENWQRAFVATFPNTSVNERHFAEEVIEYTKGQVNYITPDYSNLIKDIERATILFDGITSTPITAVTDIYKSMRQNGIAVSLDGHGVDEMLYGYNASAGEAFLSAKLAGDELYAKELLNICLSMQLSENRPALEKRLVERYQKIKLFDERMINENVIKKTLKKLLKSRFKPYRAVNALTKSDWLRSDKTAALDYLSSQHYQYKSSLSRAELYIAKDFHINSIPYNLRDFDRAAMQNSIEIRMPFMDYRLVTYLFSLDTHAKIGGGFTKRILRDSMKGIMPESIRTRQLKIGLGAPMPEWFGNELKEYILDEVSSNSFQKSEIWNGSIIKEFVIKQNLNKSWTMSNCSAFWQVFNAHILLNKK